MDKMCSAIDDSACVAVFITSRYISKVGGDNENDNCKLEFGYAMQKCTPSHMIPVVMEPSVRSTSKWKGQVGMALGRILHVDLSSDDERDFNKGVASLESEIRRRVSGKSCGRFSMLCSPHVVLTS